jgi:hypothetical protein
MPKRRPAPDRLDGAPVDGGKLALQCTEIDMEIGRGSAVDDAQPHPALALDLHQLGIGQRAVIGEIGVELDVVEMRPAMHRMLVRGLCMPMRSSAVR